MGKRVLLSGVIACCLTASAFADLVAFEDFDGGAVGLLRTTNVLHFGAGGGLDNDAFGIVSPFDEGAGLGGPSDVFDDSVENTSGTGMDGSDLLGIAGAQSSAFFALNDADAVGLNNALWTFDISGAVALTHIRIALAALGDYESSASDGFTISARVDGAPFQTIFAAQTDDAAEHTYRAFDGGGIPSYPDPLLLYIDGAGEASGVLDKSDPATGAFDTYSSILLAGEAGSELDIRLQWAGSPSGGEPMGLDDIEVHGMLPEPATMALWLVGLLGIRLRRRR